jgi:hypothetical protein
MGRSDVSRFPALPGWKIGKQRCCKMTCHILHGSGWWAIKAAIPRVACPGLRGLCASLGRCFDKAAN